MTVLYIKLTYDQTQVKQNLCERMVVLVRKALGDYFGLTAILKVEPISDLEIGDMSRTIGLEPDEVAYVALTDEANKFLSHATNKFNLPAKTIVQCALAAFDLAAMLIDNRIQHDQKEQEKGN